MRSMPLLPARSPCQDSSTPTPTEVTRPRPVTTTRRSIPQILPCPLENTDPRSGIRLLLVRVDVVDGVADGLDVLGLLVGDLDLELLLHRHHQLDDVEAVGAEVLDEGRLGLDLVLSHPELLRDDALDLRLDGHGPILARDSRFQNWRGLVARFRALASPPASHLLTHSIDAA